MMKISKVEPCSSLIQARKYKVIFYEILLMYKYICLSLSHEDEGSNDLLFLFF